MQHYVAGTSEGIIHSKAEKMGYNIPEIVV
jgi:hypothetical protein